MAWIAHALSGAPSPSAQRLSGPTPPAPLGSPLAACWFSGDVVIVCERGMGCLKREKSAQAALRGRRQLAGPNNALQSAPRCQFTAHGVDAACQDVPEGARGWVGHRYCPAHRNVLARERRQPPHAIAPQWRCPAHPAHGDRWPLAPADHDGRPKRFIRRRVAATSSSGGLASSDRTH